VVVWPGADVVVWPGADVVVWPGVDVVWPGVVPGATVVVSSSE